MKLDCTVIYPGSFPMLYFKPKLQKCIRLTTTKLHLTFYFYDFRLVLLLRLTKKHVIKICQTAYFELQCISSITGFLLKMQPRLVNIIIVNTHNFIMHVLIDALSTHNQIMHNTLIALLLISQTETQYFIHM